MVQIVLFDNFLYFTIAACDKMRFPYRNGMWKNFPIFFFCTKKATLLHVLLINAGEYFDTYSRSSVE